MNDITIKKLAYSVLQDLVDKERELLEKTLPKGSAVIQVFTKVWKTFMDLATTLDEYPVHLIKGVFGTFKSLMKYSIRSNLLLWINN